MIFKITGLLIETINYARFKMLKNISEDDNFVSIIQTYKQARGLLCKNQKYVSYTRSQNISKDDKITLSYSTHQQAYT